MWRKIIFGVVVAIFLGGMVYFFSHLKKTVAPNADALKAVPLSSAVLVEVNNFSHLWNNISTKNLIWQELLNTETFQTLNSEVVVVDSILKTDKLFQKLIENNVLYISVQMSGAMNYDYLYSIAIPATIDEDKLLNRIASYSSLKPKQKLYDGATIYFARFGNKQFAYSVYQNILIGSSSVILVEDAIRQINSGVSLSDEESFRLAKQTAGKKIDANVFINFKNIPDLLSNYFSKKFTSELKSFSELASWTSLDANVHSNHLMMSGFTFTEDEKQYLSIFKNQKPQEPDFEEIIPSNVCYFSEFVFSNFEQFITSYTKYLETKGQAVRQMDKFNRFEKKYQLKVFEDVYNLLDNEAGIFFTQLLGNDIKAHSYAYFKAVDIEKLTQNLNLFAQKIARTDTLKLDTATYKNIPVYHIPYKTFLSSLFGDVFDVISQPYFIAVNDFVVFANSKKAIELYIDSYTSDYVLKNNPEYKRVADNLASEYNVMIFNNIYRSENFYKYYLVDTYHKDIEANKDVLKNFEAAVVQMSVEAPNRFFTTFYLSYNPNHHQETETLWQVDLDTTCSMRPQVFINHYTQNKEIVIQDDNNVLYLISNTGKILWKKPLSEKIMGGIKMVDAYKNKKYQILFNTSSEIHLIDRNGNYVENYPVKIPSKATAPLSLFDYDKNRKYRILIFSGTKSYLYDIKGNIVKGYEGAETKDTVFFSAKHIQRNKKDYIVITDKSGNVYIRDRRGLPRIKITNKLPANYDFYVDGGAKPEDLFLVTADTSGVVYKLYFNDLLVKQKLIEKKHLDDFNYKEINNDNKYDILLTTGNSFLAFNQDFDLILAKELEEACQKLSIDG
ncbi:MAG: DUF3352 domain-containing protein, partial [Bacteroidetes bacterium]